MRMNTYLADMAKKATLQAKVVRSKRRLFVKTFALIFSAALVAGPSILHSKAGIGFSPILTGSMRPYANPGDVFITKTVKASTLKVGDIISVHAETTGVFYAHRIAKISKYDNLLRVITKGDANQKPEQDPFMVAPNAPVSKNILRVKWIGRPMVYLTSVQGRQAALSLIVVANVIALFLFLFREKTKAVNPLSEKTYKDLYSEEVESKKSKERQLQVFKELLSDAQVDKKIKEFEMYQQLNEIKTFQLAKEN